MPSRRHPQPTPPPLVLRVVAMIFLLRGSSATVTLLSENDSRSVATYPSRPAAFGNEFEWGLEYGARVQLPPGEDWWLCGDAKPPARHDDGEAGDVGEDADSGNADTDDDESARGFFQLRRRRAKETVSASAPSLSSPPVDSDKIIVPPDGMPGKFSVAGCTCMQYLRRSSVFNLTHSHIHYFPPTPTPCHSVMIYLYIYIYIW